MSQVWVKTPGYEGPERRHYTRTVEQLEEHIELLFQEHEEREQANFEELRKDMHRAYPNGDPVAHCNYHDKLIKAAAAQEEYWKVAKAELIKNGVNTFFAVLKTAIFLALLGAAFQLGGIPLMAKVAKFFGATA